ncbi:MAG: hypothetical protein ABSA86_14125 [Oryzomonas sp.]|jgi:hypothetical protein
MAFEAEVSVKDIVNFYIKINDAAKAKKDIAKLSTKDKAVAFEIIAASPGNHDFKIEIAKFFVYDLDGRVRRKAEMMLEDLLPGWVSDPAESILKLLKTADTKGGAHRNAAIKFLFGIIDSGSLRGAFMTLLNSRNRAHMAEIIAILEGYIDSSQDEREQVKIFDACLDIVLSDDADYNIKHHASNLLSVFFKKVQSTDLGAALKQKYIEKQIEKAEGVYRYLCSGASGLNVTFLEDLLRPLNDGGKSFQLKMLNYFKFVLEKARNPEEADMVMDIYPDYWNNDELPKEVKLVTICRRIVAAVEELWDASDDADVRGIIVKIMYGEYADKRELLEQIRTKLDTETLSDAARDKVAMMLHCFFLPGEDDALKLLAANILIFKLGDARNRTVALNYLTSYVENKNLNYAEKGSIATVMESLLNERRLVEEVRKMARYLLFITGPERFDTSEDQKAVLGQIRSMVEGNGFSSQLAAQRVLESLETFSKTTASTEKLKMAASYLEFKIRNPAESLTWDKINAQ